MGRLLGLMNAAREGKFIFGPFMPSPDRIRVPWVYRRPRHPLFVWLGLLPISAQHTQAEHQALQHWSACGTKGEGGFRTCPTGNDGE